MELLRVTASAVLARVSLMCVNKLDLHVLKKRERLSNVVTSHSRHTRHATAATRSFERNTTLTHRHTQYFNSLTARCHAFVCLLLYDGYTYVQ